MSFGAFHPLSVQQQQVWLSQAMSDRPDAYHVSRAWRLTGQLDVDALRRALRHVVEVHAALRTTFHEEGGRVRARVDAPPPDCGPRLVDISAGDSGEEDAEASGAVVAADLLAQPFDLSRDLLMRAWLLRCGPTRYLLVLCWHHLVVDEWSIQLLERGIADAYTAHREGRSPAMPRPVLDYTAFVRWQEQYLTGPSYDEDVAAWCDLLRGAPEQAGLPTDFSRSASLSQRGAAVRFEVDAGLATAVRESAVRLRTTLYVVALTAFHAVLTELTGRDDHVVVSPFAIRALPGTEGLVGLLVDLVAVRVRRSGSDTWANAVTATRAQVLAAFDRGQVPFSRVVRALAPRRDPSRTPISLVLFQVVDELPGLREEALWSGLQVSRWAAIAQTTSRYDLELQLLASAGEAGLTGWLTYRGELFRADRAEFIAERFLARLRTVAGKPEPEAGQSAGRSEMR